VIESAEGDLTGEGVGDFDVLDEDDMNPLVTGTLVVAAVLCNASTINPLQHTGLLLILITLLAVALCHSLVIILVMS
jgi:hypothetical protein